MASMTTRDLRRFGLLLSVSLGILFVVSMLSGWPGWIGRTVSVGLIIVLGLALFWPTGLAGLRATMRLIGLGAATVINHTLMVLVYFTLIAPLGLLMRLAGRDVMSRKRPASGWHSVDRHGHHPGFFEDAF